MTPTRRDFLKTSVGSTALVSLASSVPLFMRDAAALAAPSKGDNVLVVIQMSGGNDGLNTVVPYADDAYARNRNTLRLSPNGVHKIDDYIGLHPSLDNLFKLLDANQLAILQGVGYPNPNRSHFESMDIWQTARVDMTEANAGLGGRRTGWIGRYLDTTAAAGLDVPALHIGGGRQPLALAGEQARAASVQSMDAFKLDTGGDTSLRQSIERIAAVPRGNANPGEAGDDLLGFLQRSTVGALASSQRVHDALARYDNRAAYPGTALAQQLRTVAQLIDAGMGTRVYYLELGGFDTHANQAPQQAGLLRELGDAIGAFMADLTARGHADRTLLMTFSEFGRRVKENASQGTDHGVAAPMFLAGGRVTPGLVGKHPSLTDLTDGDLIHHTDFRRVYATILRDWLGAKPAPVLLGEYEPVVFLR
ncbi:MAG: DUF1501 domain-containing protein [Phycisphaera sp.]|nr:DUF1501 domain-containing protein [Phycisphaera sp.]